MGASEGDSLDLHVLRLERAWLNRRQHDGRKANAVAELGLSETAYYQRLVALIDDPGAWRFDFTVMDAVARRVARDRRAR